MATPGRPTPPPDPYGGLAPFAPNPYAQQQAPAPATRSAMPPPQVPQQPPPGRSDFGRSAVQTQHPSYPSQQAPPVSLMSQLDFMTPAMQKYVDQFKASQGQQQQAINAGIVQALGGLGERRDAAAKVAATIPGEFDKAYNEATQSQARAQAASGFGHATEGGNADEGLITAANTQQQAAGHANQPLLQAGITADYSKGKTTLENTHMQNQLAIQQAQQQFDQQMVMAQAQWQQQQAQQQTGYAHDIEMAKLNASLQHPGGVLTPQEQMQMANESQRTQTADAAAIKAGFTSGEEYTKYQNDPRLQFAMAARNGRFSNGGSYEAGGNKQLPKKGDAISSWRYLIGFNDPKLIQAALASGWNPDEYKKAAEKGALG